jgi:hypothetical protein
MMSIPFTLRALWLRLLAIAAFSFFVAALGQTQANLGGNSPSKSSGTGKVVLYAAVGAELTQYDVDIDAATLTKRGSLTLPANVQEAALHPSRRYLM